MKSYVVKTLGCKANWVDSQLIESSLQKEGWQPAESKNAEVELCIVNSCTVTDEADKQSRKLAAKLAKENPSAKIVITGCGAEVDPEKFSQSPGVDYVVGNQNKNGIIDLLITSDILKQQKILGTTKSYKELLSKHPMDREWPAVLDSFQTPPLQLQGHSDKTRSFLKIQEGCGSFCTYCIIPYGRGPSRSLQTREVLNQVSELVSQGVREIVLTGTNIGDYGTDWGGEPKLGDLIAHILDDTALERLRVSSLDPTEITPQIFQLMTQSPRFCPHFHVSLQSPHSKILKLMKRRYGFTEVDACLNRIANLQVSPGKVFVGMDLITGFPGETDEDFDWTFKTLSELPWMRLHVFPYSERTGTPATKLPNSVPMQTRVSRAKKLNQMSLERLTRYYRTVLETSQSSQKPLQTVLLEKPTQWEWVAGFTSNYLRVLVSRKKSDEVERNQIVSVMPREIMIDSAGNDVALVSDLV